MMTIIAIIITVVMSKIIGGSLVSVVAILYSNMQSIAFSNNNSIDLLLDKTNMAELFDIASGIFAVILYVLLLLVAYRNLKSTRMLLVFSCIWNICCSCNSVKTRCIYTNN